MVGVNLTKVHHKHIRKFHNETPQYNDYMLVKMF
jgi:hypothetical protein